MGIQLLSVSHKIAPVEIRSYFAFDEECQIQIMLRLREHEKVMETVMIATCNRTELYVYTEEDADTRDVYNWMQKVVLESASLQNAGDYIRLYQEEGAVSHLFKVAAGLDSMILGEDQILGQVKRAHEHSHTHQLSGTYLNTLFRMAVTSAKKIKTETALSKTPVSTASLALKAAEKELGTLKGKKILVIGATGKIGGIVLKNAECMDGVQLYVTMRTHSLIAESTGHRTYRVIHYEDRYQVMDQMDVIISATSSPHYTLTKQHVEQQLKELKKRVFIDLAVPMDIEGSVSDLENTFYYNIEDFKHLARQNNEKKELEVKAAGLILEEFQEQFQKWMIFQKGFSTMDKWKKTFQERVREKGIETAVEKFFYDMREECSAKELEKFFDVVARITRN